ncbi:NAD(P)-dependent oxidoreductase [Sphingomonas sp. ABOLD]|uniref:3-hydroxyisobutyrate dehydrogenase-like beta-hydroxyacid dehydrogenase n=1 Tax=Sphingomonas trueperi TaxID=53317 RepID=A0A7X6BAU7_9SPHN|nr:MULTISPECIES: NAD(P)-dependent oxidoreductase [Sphingomonas]NJB96304.1 3-hydroxyisobutyrate dehydrogenase-like beta-hydroxyacid dehydrogenase [Sphingomonas trueperi]RSV42600.1 NAD(P)-dependent oxidoreductase [Sphingomonas sp. ABOLE]RSV43451.1 NAD(P)-dependent oxidoreductase [Sphingomonas sp. ABOLD]
MQDRIALIGFGEAGSTFARAGGWEAGARVFDRKTDGTAAAAMHARYAEAGVEGAATLAEALAYRPLVLSLVTADQALAVAQAAAPHLAPGALYCDGNSVAPQTKQAAARAVEAAGAHYVDLAILAPVDPARLAVPVLLSGGQAQAAASVLAALGFQSIDIVGDAVGRASSIKMIRSVMIKGMEALTAECMLAAEAAGVRDAVLASLDASERQRPWETRADYNLDRMLVHGLRRAAEMEEVVKTLEALGTGAAMTRGTVERQRAIGALGLGTPPEGLGPKLAAIEERTKSA